MNPIFVKKVFSGSFVEAKAILEQRMIEKLLPELDEMKAQLVREDTADPSGPVADQPAPSKPKKRRIINAYQAGVNAKKRKLGPSANPITNPDPNDAEEMGQYNQWNQGYQSVKEEKYETWTDSLQELSRELVSRYKEKAGKSVPKLRRFSKHAEDQKRPDVAKYFADKADKREKVAEEQDAFKTSEKKIKPFPKKVKLIKKKKKLGLHLLRKN